MDRLRYTRKSEGATALCEGRSCNQCGKCVRCGYCTCTPLGHAITQTKNFILRSAIARDAGDPLRAAVCLSLARQYHAIAKQLLRLPELTARRRRG